MKMCQRIACVVPVVLTLLVIGCPTVMPDGDGTIPEGFTNADAGRGGQLYDKFWSVAGVAEPSTDHPLWASRPDQTSNTRTGADTWRCKECHGWDYKGVNGAYGGGSHRTGIAGIFGTDLTPQQVFDVLAATGGHNYLSTGLSNDDLWDLAKFVLQGQIDTDDIIDGTGAFTGDTASGQALYDNGIGGNPACAICHGSDGLAVPPGADPAFEDFVGLIANDNPWEFQHKVRFGQPGTAMPATFGTTATLQDVADLSAYAQSLPEAP